MSLKKIQQSVDEWTGQFTPQYWQPLEIIATLTEEVGELAREVNHRFGAKRKKETEGEQELSDEIGDILFVLCCLANSQKIDLDDAFKRTMEKKYSRDNDRYVKKAI